MRDPIWAILAAERRSQRWLAQQIGYSYGHVRRVSCGAALPSADFKAKCAAVFGIPVGVLFCSERSTSERSA